MDTAFLEGREIEKSNAGRRSMLTAPAVISDRSLLMHKPRVVFVGSCQASALCAAYNTYVGRTESARAKRVEVRAIAETDKLDIAIADIVVAQVTDLESAFDPSWVNGRLIWFPYVSGIFMWPHGGTSAHPRSASPPERGDEYLNAMIRKGIGVSEAAASYLARDMAHESRCARRLELCLQTQDIRDEKSGMGTTRYFRDRLHRERLFITPGHPCVGLFEHLALQVFAKIGIDADRFRGVIAKKSFFPSQELPIHPGVAAALDLPYGGPDHRYETDFGPMTFEEWARAYVGASD
jgi:hypothetical protein